MRNQTTIKTYSKLIKFNTFEDRLRYLKIPGSIGEDTFGSNRYINQAFYSSKEWRSLRNYIITRDLGCDLGVVDHEIFDDYILIHHMNPITEYDIINKTDFLLNPEYLITTIKNTHNIIHFGSEEELVYSEPIIRFKNDTCPWRH